MSRMNHPQSAACLAVALAFGGCVAPTDQESATEGTTYVVVTTADYTAGAGGMSIINPEDFSVSSDILSLSSDNEAIAHDGAVYILERSSVDNLMRVDGEDLLDGVVAYQKALAVGANAHDIAFASSSKAYVAQYGSTGLAVVDPFTGTVTGTVALGQYKAPVADVTVPHMEAVAVLGSTCFVALQRLVIRDGPWGPAPGPGDLPGLIVMVNVVRDEVTDTVSLSFSNPQGMVAFAGDLYVSSTGEYGALDGGIEKVDPITLATKVVAREQGFAGDISNMVFVSSTKAYVAVFDNATYRTSIVEFNPTSGAVGATVPGVTNGFGGMAYDGKYLYVGDQGDAFAVPPVDAGVVVVDPTGNSQVGGKISVGLSPNSIAAVTVRQ